jgi:hypothetical protein
MLDASLPMDGLERNAQTARIELTNGYGDCRTVDHSLLHAPRTEPERVRTLRTFRLITGESFSAWVDQDAVSVAGRPARLWVTRSAASPVPLRVELTQDDVCVEQRLNLIIGGR